MTLLVTAGTWLVRKWREEDWETNCLNKLALKTNLSSNGLSIGSSSSLSVSFEGGLCNHTDFWQIDLTGNDKRQNNRICLCDQGILGNQLNIYQMIKFLNEKLPWFWMKGQIRFRKWYDMIIDPRYLDWPTDLPSLLPLDLPPPGRPCYIPHILKQTLRVNSTHDGHCDISFPIHMMILILIFKCWISNKIYQLYRW